MITTTDTDYNLDRHLIAFLQDTPFFAELSRHIRKSHSLDVPTAGVAYDPKYDDITLYWNSEFFAPLTDAQVRGVLTHEFYHLIFRHLTERRKTPHKMWNVATDLAINSIIMDHSKNNKAIDLPEGGLVPGVFPKGPEGREFTAEEKAAMPIAELIAELPLGQASEWYYDKLKEKVEEEQAKGNGDPLEGMDSMDDHGGWD